MKRKKLLFPALLVVALCFSCGQQEEKKEVKNTPGINITFDSSDYWSETEEDSVYFWYSSRQAECHTMNDSLIHDFVDNGVEYVEYTEKTCNDKKRTDPDFTLVFVGTPATKTITKSEKIY